MSDTSCGMTLCCNSISVLISLHTLPQWPLWRRSLHPPSTHKLREREREIERKRGSKRLSKSIKSPRVDDFVPQTWLQFILVFAVFFCLFSLTLISSISPAKFPYSLSLRIPLVPSSPFSSTKKFVLDASYLYKSANPSFGPLVRPLSLRSRLRFYGTFFPSPEVRKASHIRKFHITPIATSIHDDASFTAGSFFTLFAFHLRENMSQ